MLLLFLAIMLIVEPLEVKSVPDGATETSLISIEVYWAITAGGFGDWPEESEWNVLYQNQDINLSEEEYGVYLYIKVNGTVLLDYSKWVEVSCRIGHLSEYGFYSSSGFNCSNQASCMSGFQTEHWDPYHNSANATVCVNTTNGDYYYNRRYFHIHFGEEPTTTTTTTTTTAGTTDDVSDTTTSDISTDDHVVIPQVALLSLATIVVVAILFFISKKKHPADQGIETPDTMSKEITREVFLVVCPYCGAKNEQGRAHCKNCGGKI